MITPLVGAELGGFTPPTAEFRTPFAVTSPRLNPSWVIDWGGSITPRLPGGAGRRRGCLIRLPTGGQIGGQNRNNVHNSLIYIDHTAEDSSAISLFLVLFHCGQDLRQAIGAVTNVLSDFQFVSEFAP